MELDGSVVYHTQPDNTLAWRVGNGSSRCVAIELTHATDRETFERQWEEAVAWCADYLSGRGWGIWQLVSHRDYSRRWGGSVHMDPDGYFAAYGRSWEQFKTAVAGRMNVQTTGGHDSGFAGGTYRCTVPALNLRTAPSLSGRVAGTLREGETALLDSWYTTADGWSWGACTGVELHSMLLRENPWASQRPMTIWFWPGPASRAMTWTPWRAP